MSAHRRRQGLALAVAAVLASAMALLGPSAPSGAAGVANPGSATFTVDLGGFLNLAGRALSLPSATTAVQCADGVNNDTAIDDTAVPPAQQDANIDFDGGASQGVSPVTAVDAQCNSGGAGKPSSSDDSEAKAGHQPRAYLTVQADVDSDGNVTADAADITFPTFYVFSKAANGVIDIVSKPTGPITGTLDPTTGQVDLQIDWQIEIIQAFFKIDCIAPISMDLSTDPDAPANSGTIPVSPAAVDPDTGDFTVTGNQFAVGAMAPNPTPTFTPITSEALCTSVGGGFGLPAAAAASAAELRISSSQTFTPVDPPQMTGVVTAAGSGDPLAGITVTLMRANPSWVVAATTTTDAEGRYVFEGMATGDYQVRFFDGSGTYERTWFDGRKTYKSATPVALSEAGSVIADQVLALAPSGSLNGRAVDKDGNPISGIRVNVYRGTDGYYAAATTGVNGYYLLKGVPAGSYKVWFTDPQGRYVSQWGRFKLLGFNADPISVGTDAVWVSAQLQSLGSGT